MWHPKIPIPSLYTEQTPLEKDTRTLFTPLQHTKYRWCYKSHHLPVWTGSINLTTLPTWLSCRLTWSLENVLPATTWAWLCLVSFYFSYSWTAPSHSQKASGSGKRLKNFMEEPKMINQQHFRGSTPILVLTMTTAWWGISPHSQL